MVCIQRSFNPYEIVWRATQCSHYKRPLQATRGVCKVFGKKELLRKKAIQDGEKQRLRDAEKERQQEAQKLEQMRLNMVETGKELNG